MVLPSQQKLDKQSRDAPSEQAMNDGGSNQSPGEYYFGTLEQLAVGHLLEPNPLPAGSAEAHLDSGRAVDAGLRSKAVWAASSIRDATAIAAIRSYSRVAPVPHEALHVYRVDLQPFHAGPVAIIEEMQSRLEAGEAGLEQLVCQYWEPTAAWHIQELIAPSLRVLEKVPTATERDVYIRRWVQYNQDRQRAEVL